MPTEVDRPAEQLERDPRPRTRPRRSGRKPVQVVPTDSIPAGLAAMVAFEPDRTAEENAAEMREPAREVKTGEVTIASRDVEMNGLEVRKGAWLGLADGEAIAGGPDFDEVAAAVAERLLEEPRGLLTLLKGADEPDLTALLEADRRSSIPASSSTCRTAASRTIRSCSLRNRLRGWPSRSASSSSRTTRVPRGARVAARAAGRHGGRGLGRRRLVRCGGRSRAPARRRADGLPAARARRRAGDAGRA